MRPLSVIGAGLVGGSVIFALIAIGLPFLTGAETEPRSGDPGGPDASVIDLLSMVHAALFAAALPLAMVLPRRMASQAGTGLQQTLIVRWAILEGPALFGSVVVLLGGLEGRLPGESLYYANLVSTAVFVLLVATDLRRIAEARGDGVDYR